MVSIKSHMFRLCIAFFRKFIKTSLTFQCRCWSPSLSSLFHMMYFTRSVWWETPSDHISRQILCTIQIAANLYLQRQLWCHSMVDLCFVECICCWIYWIKG